MTKIDHDMAYRLHYVRGLRLPVEADYTDSKLKDIAVRLNTIMNQLYLVETELWLLLEKEDVTNS